MTYQEKLIAFMEGKKKKLNEIAKESNSEIPDYFTEKDSRNINKWDDEKSKYVWTHMMGRENKLEGLGNGVCPFCIYYNDLCSICDYPLNHGPCNYAPCDYLTLKKKINFKLLTNEFYKNLIQDIEENNV
jgi:hypothetical protein